MLAAINPLSFYSEEERITGFFHTPLSVVHFRRAALIIFRNKTELSHFSSVLFSSRLPLQTVTDNKKTSQSDNLFLNKGKTL